MKFINHLALTTCLFFTQNLYASILSKIYSDLDLLNRKVTSLEFALQKAKIEKASYMISMSDLILLINDKKVTNELKCIISAKLEADIVEISISDLNKKRTTYFLYNVNDEIVPLVEGNTIQLKIWRVSENRKSVLVDFFKFNSDEKLTHVGVSNKNSTDLIFGWCNVHELSLDVK